MLFAPHRVIQAEHAAKQHCQRQVGHGVDVLRGVAAGGRGREEEWQQEPSGKHQHAAGPALPRQGGSGGQAGQRQRVNGGQAGPLGPVAERLEQERNQARGRVGETGFQVDRVSHVERAALHDHLGGQAPGCEFVPLGKHGLLYAEQHPDKRSTA